MQIVFLTNCKLVISFIFTFDFILYFIKNIKNINLFIKKTFVFIFTFMSHLVNFLKWYLRQFSPF